MYLVCVCVCVCVCVFVCVCSCFRDIMRSFVPLRTHNIRPTHVFLPTGVWTGLIFVFSETLFIRWQIFLQIERIPQNVAFQCINHTHHTHRLCKAPKTSPGYLLHSSGSPWPDVVQLETVIVVSAPRSVSSEVKMASQQKKGLVSALNIILIRLAWYLMFLHIISTR